MEFTPAQRAAFALARKLSYEPHLMTDADFDALRKHYSDLQILEMVIAIAANNSTNRWKEGAGIPQSRDSSNFLRAASKPVPSGRPLPIKTYLTPTPEQFRNKITKVAPLAGGESTDTICRPAVCRRPPLEGRDEVEKALGAARKRAPRLPLVDEAEARRLLPADWSKEPLPQWVRLLANFPKDGKSRFVSLAAGEEKGDLSPLLKAQVTWIVARQDRAWYAVGDAKRRLRELGWSNHQIYKLDGDWGEFSAAERALFTVARQLAASPIVLTESEVAAALRLSTPSEVVQLVNYVSNRALFNRITEAANLQLEP